MPLDDDVAEERPRFNVEPLDLGECLLDNLDDVASVLAIAEGDDYR